MNKYRIENYTPAELAALEDGPLLWWLTWQQLGCVAINISDSPDFALSSLRNGDMEIGQWWPDKEEPNLFIGGGAKPDLDAILAALDEAIPGNLLLDIKARVVETDLGPITVPAPTVYLAAARALLVWQRGRG